jgi:molecular chaperone GrpE
MGGRERSGGKSIGNRRNTCGSVRIKSHHTLNQEIDGVTLALVALIQSFQIGFKRFKQPFFDRVGGIARDLSRGAPIFRPGGQRQKRENGNDGGYPDFHKQSPSTSYDSSNQQHGAWSITNFPCPTTHSRGLTALADWLQLSAMQADTHPHDPANATEISENPAEAAEDKAGESAAQSPELDPWEQLEAEAAKWKELSLRTAAEMENLRKRTAREREEAVRFANQRLLEDLLPVIDNFEMGMQAAAQDSSSMIYIGMDMVRRQLIDFLGAQGVEEIHSDGDFDPNLHEAVAQEDCGDGAEGRILRTTRKGYKLRDRLLRPASVVVSKIPTTPEGGEA